LNFPKNEIQDENFFVTNNFENKVKSEDYKRDFEYYFGKGGVIERNIKNENENENKNNENSEVTFGENSELTSTTNDGSFDSIDIKNNSVSQNDQNIDNLKNSSNTSNSNNTNNTFSNNSSNCNNNPFSIKDQKNIDSFGSFESTNTSNSNNNSSNFDYDSNNNENNTNTTINNQNNNNSGFEFPN